MITFAPSFSNYRKHVAGAVPALIILMVIDYWRVQQPLPVYLTGCVVLIGLGVTFAVLYFRNTQLVAERHSLTTRNLFGVTREISGARLGKAVLVSHLATNGNASPLRLIVLDSDGRALVRWTGLTWTLDQMNSLVETLGIPLDTMDQPITPSELKERYPRGVRSIEAYPVRWGLGLSVAIIAVVVGVVLALNAPS
jgi:hypothetical protein